MFEPQKQNIDEVELRDRAMRLLLQYKEKEKQTKFYKERLNKKQSCIVKIKIISKDTENN